MTSEYLRLPLLETADHKTIQGTDNKIWKKMKQVLLHKLPSHANFVVFNPKKKAYFFGNDNSVLQYQFKTSKIVSSWSKEESIIKSFKPRKDGQLAAFSTLSGEAKILSLLHKSILKSFKFSNQPICSIDILERKPYLAIGGDNGSFEVKDFAAEMSICQMPSLHSDYLRKCMFFADSDNQILTGGQDRKIKCLDLRVAGFVTAEINLENELTDMTCCENEQFVSISGREVKLWDTKNLSTPIITSKIGAKSLSCVKCVQNKLYISSLDGSLKIATFDQSDFKVVSQKSFKQPIANFDIGIGKDLNIKSIAISTYDGAFQILSREKGTNEEQAGQMIDEKLTEQERNIYKMLTTGIKGNEMSTFKYFDRGVWGVPDKYSVKIEKPKTVRLTSYDKYFRKFKFDEALKTALKTDDTIVILSVLEELIIRNVLGNTIKLLDPTTINKFAEFILKKCDSINCQRIIAHALESFIENASNHIFLGELSDTWLAQISLKLDIELQNAERSIFIQSYYE